MINDDDKLKLTNRLQRIAGQVSAIQRMMEEDTYCVDVLTQIAAARGALDKVGQLLLEKHVKTCIADAIKSQNPKQREDKLDELIEILRKYARLSR